MGYNIPYKNKSSKFGTSKNKSYNPIGDHYSPEKKKVKNIEEKISDINRQRAELKQKKHELKEELAEKVQKHNLKKDKENRNKLIEEFRNPNKMKLKHFERKEEIKGDKDEFSLCAIMILSRCPRNQWSLGIFANKVKKVN